MLIPSFILLISTFSERNSQFFYQKFMLYFGIFGSLILPIFSIIFMIKTQTIPLMIHLIAGILGIIIPYVTKLLMFINQWARQSFLCEMLGISTVFAYSMFQTIFQVGEKLADNGPMLMKTTMKRNQLDNFLIDADPFLTPVEF